MRSNNKDVNGIILIDKPTGMTSRDVVDIVSKKFQTRKVGHTGTLDPLATGVLVLGINKGTKLSELLVANDKVYIAEFILGMLTDTLDTTGKLLDEEDINISEEEVRNALSEMIGTYEQETPIYSAVKVNGMKLYEYAWNNIPVELPKRMVNVKELELLDYRAEKGKVIISVKCHVSKGTYIRAIANDLGKKLDTYGIMSKLIRTMQGKFKLEDCYTLNQLEKDEYKVLSFDDFLDFPTVEINEEEYFKIKNGQIIDNIYGYDMLTFTYNNRAVAIYKKYDKDDSKIKPYRIL